MNGQHSDIYNQLALVRYLGERDAGSEHVRPAADAGRPVAMRAAFAGIAAALGAVRRRVIARPVRSA